MRAGLGSHHDATANTSLVEVLEWAGRDCSGLSQSAVKIDRHVAELSGQYLHRLLLTSREPLALLLGRRANRVFTWRKRDSKSAIRSGLNSRHLATVAGVQNNQRSLKGLAAQVALSQWSRMGGAYLGSSLYP